MAEKICDRDGWPINPGARVHVRRRETALVPGFRLEDGRAPLPAISGTVVRTWTDKQGRDLVEVKEFDTWCRRTVRASDARVQAGETQASKRNRATEVALRTRGRKAAVMEAAR
jgi:hypothetical protein